jgi:hypothetical protein
VTPDAQRPAPCQGPAAKTTPPPSDAIAAHRSDRVRRPAGVTADGYAAGTLAKWTASRERVAGGIRVHRDPEVAAAMLAEALGGRECAYRWLVATLGEVGR